MDPRLPSPATPSRADGPLPQRGSGFTLLEVLIATAILGVILMLVFSAISQTASVWRKSSDKIDSFQQARLAFEVIRRTLSQATLNTYLDYDSATAPTRYLRKSDLTFRCAPAGGSMPGTAGTGEALFFQAPVAYTTNTNYSGLDLLLNTCGYFVSYTTNNVIPPHVTSAANPARYRLMQLMVPTETANTLYATNGTAWFTAFTNQAVPIAENVIALIVRPQDPGAATPDLTDDYTYDSTLNTTTDPQPVTANQLPPVIQVSLVAIDETSAKRVAPATIATALSGKFQNPTLFETDLKDLTDYLADLKIGYRVFSEAVPIRESKWTK